MQEDFVLQKTSKPFANVEIFVLYDSFTFNLFQRKYLIYKRKLYVIIIFCKKYNYLCKHPYQFIIVYINHKFFIHFLESDLHKEIYNH